MQAAQQEQAQLRAACELQARKREQVLHELAHIRLDQRYVLVREYARQRVCAYALARKWLLLGAQLLQAGAQCLRAWCCAGEQS